MENNVTELLENGVLINQSSYNFYTRDVIFITGLNLTALVAVIGNYLILNVISNDVQMKSKTFSLMANMAVSDLMAGLFIWCEMFFCSSYFMEHFVYGEYVCAVNQMSLLTTYFVSTFTLTAIAVDRHRGIIVSPLHQSNKTVAIKLLSWIFGAILNLPIMTANSIPEFFGHKELLTFRVFYKTSLNQTIIRIRGIFVFMCQFGVPLIITSFCYIRIVLILKNRKLIGHHENQRRVEFQKRNYRIVKMLILVLICFTLAWFPIHLSHIYVIFTSTVFIDEPEIPSAFLFLYWLALSSCFFNSLIYFWYYKEFRQQIKKTMSSISVKSFTFSLKSRSSSKSSNCKHDVKQNAEVNI
ncbi:putative G-protein coupled receptor 83-like protein [Leptotrombidium deliense]|uniref:Putative G-protein coupled receptor 83-like protein n=1 Tax=Leptotrombidium deliense TaxID=299467 RepID=A0A443S287_9ACAR|nr:putative G-protein coupled receptor 83-like protein [Leptotrombidium deliense]